jgi:tripartite-type tricarboxylate transporter receptor subunit TctC
MEGFEASQWYGLLTVAGTPKPIVDRLNREIIKVLNSPETIEIFKKEGLEPMHNTPEEFAKYIKDQIALWRPVIQQANIIID